MDDTTTFSEVLLMLVKQVLPILLAVLAPFVTKGLASLIGSTGKWGPVISSIVGTVITGAAAAGMGQSVDMQGAMAAVGGGTGLTAHAVMQSKPIEGAVKSLVILMLLPGLLLAGCYTNPRTWVEWNGHEAMQFHESGHGWTEKGVVTVITCDWVDLAVSPVDKMEYCPPKRRGTETTVAQVFDSTSNKVIPAVIHGLSFMAGMFGGAAILGSMIPSSQITQLNNNGGLNLFGSTIQGQPIQGLRFAGPIP